MQAMGLKVVADFDKLVDPSAKQRLESFIEACNAEPFSLEKMNESAKHIEKEDDSFLRNHTNFPEVVKELRKVAIKQMMDSIFASGPKTELQLPEIPTALLDQERELMKNWTAKFVATGHFINSLAAADFSEQLLEFMNTPSFLPPPEPRKIPVLH